MVTVVLQLRSALLILALGLIGAGLAVGFLLLTPTDGSPTAYGRLIAEPLPNVVFVAAAGFGIGALVAVVWSFAWRLLVPQVPSA